MDNKRDFSLLLVAMILALLLGGCSGDDPDLDPPYLSAQIDATGTGTYTTYNSAEIVTISGQVQAGYHDLDLETDSASTVRATLGSVSGSAPLLDWTATVTNLEEGSNFVVVSASDEIGNRTQVGLLIILDLTPPTISVLQSLTPTSLGTQTLAGAVDDDALLTIDGNNVPVDQSLWEYAITGLDTSVYNVVTYNIAATDPAGNYNSLKFDITVDPASPGLSIDPVAHLDATDNSLLLTGQRGGANAADISLTLVNNLSVSVATVVNSAIPDGWEADIDPLFAGITLATATLHNTAAIYNSLTVPVATTQIFLDTVGPLLSKVQPIATSVTAPIDTEVTFRFNERIQIFDTSNLPVATATGLASLFSLTDADGTLIDGDLAFDDLTRTATFKPTSSLASATEYHATLLKDDGTFRIVDLAENPVDDATITDWTFTTAAQ